MKRKLTKEEYEKIPDALKAEYKERGGKYYANIEDEDDAIEELRRAKQNEINEHKGTKEELAKLKQQLEELTNEGHRKAGDVKALEESWKSKYSSRETELLSERDEFKNACTNFKRDAITTAMAAKISNSPSIMKRILDERVSNEFDGENWVTRILGPDGKVSAMSIEDLEKEIIANKEYASIVVGSRASGGAGSSQGTGTAGSRMSIKDSQGKEADLATLDPAVFAEHIKANRSMEN